MSVEHTNVKFFHTESNRHTVFPSCYLVHLHGFPLWWPDLPIALQFDLLDTFSYFYRISLRKLQQKWSKIEAHSCPFTSTGTWHHSRRTSSSFLSISRTVRWQSIKKLMSSPNVFECLLWEEHCSRYFRYTASETRKHLFICQVSTPEDGEKQLRVVIHLVLWFGIFKTSLAHEMDQGYGLGQYCGIT